MHKNIKIMLLMTLRLKNILDDHRYFDISVSEDNKHLRLIHWLRKLRKKPFKIRFIFKAPICSLK